MGDCKRNKLPSGDAEPFPNPFTDPFTDPFDLENIKATQKYLNKKGQPHANDPSVMHFRIGHEFGIGGSYFINLRKFTYSQGVQKNLSLG